jgi:replicative DNA helicase
MSTYAEQTLGGVFPQRKDRLEILVRVLREDHWPPELQKTFELLRRYYVLTQGVPKPEDWKNMLDRAGMEPATAEGFLRVYKKLYDLEELADHEWRYALEVMREDRAKQLMLEALTDSVRVLTEGVTDRRGNRTYGYDEARNLLTTKLGEIESLQMDAESTPEGDVLSESREAFAKFIERRDARVHEGVYTGLDTLDTLTYGAQRGEFWLVAAYSGHGKSQTLTNIAWRAVVDGYNVVYFTLETLRDQVALRFQTRHSHHERFGSPEGLRYNDLKSGSLTESDLVLWKSVLHDLGTNDQYGRFELIWTPRGTSADTLKMKLDILATQRRIDLVIVDYAGLMGPGKRVETRQQGLVEILQGLKGLATGHNRGHGVPLISAYQTSRQRLEDARSSGGYTLDALAETAEAERSSDLVMTLLRQHDDDTDVFAQVLKYRDGPKADFYLETDFARSLVRDREASGREEFGGLL